MTSTDTPLVLVHGNPECDAVWGPLLDHLDRPDVRLLSPPGFGAPLPGDFAPTIDGYHDWLVGELEAIGRPVDLVGHDMGGSRVVHVAMTRPDLLRSWASDTLGSFDPGYVWHPLAQQWADPVDGERAVAELMGGTRTRRTASMIVRGVRDGRVASAMAAAQGPEMGRAIVAFYRSSAQPAMAQLGRHLERASERPGLCILATRDVVVGTEVQRRRSAARARAAVVALDAGHWWHVEAPAASATALETFWRQVNLLNDTQGIAA
jgi:pimeloyl-ACP methyl ester carboxylesterase